MHRLWRQFRVDLAKRGKERGKFHKFLQVQKPFIPFPILYSFAIWSSFVTFRPAQYIGPAELGAEGAQLRTHFLTNWQLRTAFSRKKNFENTSKTDQVRDKKKRSLQTINLVVTYPTTVPSETRLLPAEVVYLPFLKLNTLQALGP